VPLCPPQIPHAAGTRTRAAAVGSQRLTAELRHGLSSFSYCATLLFENLLSVFVALSLILLRQTVELLR
jgi:hypothetical protein